MLRTAASRISSSPVIIELSLIQRRCASSGEHYMKYGAGGRSSFSGTVATVFGATGFMGRYVINRLARAGTQIVVPYRGDEHDIRYIHVMGDLGQITFVAYDIRDPASIAKAVQHSNVAINLVGREYETRNFTFEDCMVTGSRNIASACADAGVERLIHVSHLSAAGNSPSLYLQAKAKGERAITEAFPSATIMRPAECYGHEDKYLNKYAYLNKLPLGIPLVGNGMETIKRPVLVSDVAQAIVNAAADDSSAGKTFELYGPEAYYLYDLVEYVFKLIKKPYKPYNVPRAAYELMGRLGEMSIFSPKITRDMVFRQYLSNDINEEMPTFEDLNITPVSLNVAALDILRRHRDYYNYSEALSDDEACKPVAAYQ